MTSNPSTPDTDGPKTETTLTTRIRINIPGSRPIPPVVVRKPVSAEAEKDRETQPEPEAAPARTPAPASPRALTAGPAASAAPAVSDGPAGRAEPDDAGNNWFAPRRSKAPAPAAAAPLPTRTPAAPGPTTAPLPIRTPAPPARPGAAAPGGAPAAGFAPGAPAVPGPRTGGPAQDFAGGPAQDFAAPQAAAPAGSGFDGPGFDRPGAPGGADATQGFPAFPGDGGPATEPFPAYGAPAGRGGPAGPAGPTGGPALGSTPLGGPGADEAPRWPGPGMDDPMAPPVPPPGPGAPGAAAPRTPRPAPARPAAPKPAPKPTKVAKARSKLVLLGGGVFALFGVAYGAGLLLNHSDVPKGTTVLGVDISGSRDEAVAKLQTAFGNRAATPLQLTVSGKPAELKPEKAGLSLDAQTTVRNAAGSDYNPITVIGSLLGNQRVADPVLPVDEEKLQVALQELAGTAGTVTEGTIKFDTGKAVAVPGKAGTTLDAGASADLVTKAFRELVATGKTAPVELPVTNKEPAVGQAELDRAMKEFAEPAMSGIATVKAGPKSLAFGPKSLPKILSMQVVEGRLVEKYDLEALKTTYGNTFDGVLITRGTGDKTPVTPQDVAGALGKALRGKTAAERTATIDTNPS
ncbi:hypothetical protein ACFVGY_10170 [Streptomyces sp. NPDC127106]|uniref:hypothetical protein n=1 Tax=Streptomyces sp. NPDC127106 TaxID=3345360 RepID=UPI00363F92FB